MFNAIDLTFPCNNTWHNGYPSGGNYWDDYTGVDNFKGPNQILPGSDGIGDTPYAIPFGNEDRYPLMKPWPNSYKNNQASEQNLNQQYRQHQSSSQQSQSFPILRILLQQLGLNV